MTRVTNSNTYWGHTHTHTGGQATSIIEEIKITENSMLEIVNFF